MDIFNIEQVFLRKIQEAIQEIDEKQVKVTLLKKIASQAIDSALGRKSYCLRSAPVYAMFAGRNRAWAKINISIDNLAWNIIKQTLSAYKDNNDATNLLDLFEQTGFAWMRYASCRNNMAVFDLRVKGSKLEDNIKCCIPFSMLTHLENLDGVPHKIGLEEGIFNMCYDEKEIIDKEVDKEELSGFGIMTLEDIIG